MAKVSAVVGSQIFLDSLIRMDSISKEIDGSTLFQLSWDDVGNSSVSISCGQDCVVIVALWEHDNRHDDLIDLLQLDGWMLRKEQQMKWNRDGEYGNTRGVLSQIIQANNSISFSRPENSLPISVFVFEGKIITHVFDI